VVINILRYIRVVSWFDIKLNRHESLVCIYYGHGSHLDLQFNMMISSDSPQWILICSYESLPKKLSITSHFFCQLYTTNHFSFSFDLRLESWLFWVSYMILQLIILLCHSFLLKNVIILLVMYLTVHNKSRLTIRKIGLPIHNLILIW